MRRSTQDVTAPNFDIVGMFDSIAHKYDFLNTLFSAGLDRLWRNRAAQLVSDSQPLRVLDLATGTGALARAIARKTGRPIVVADASQTMLDLLKTKRVGSPRLVPVRADGIRLPFAPGTFNAVAMAFGMRNMPSLPASLMEMRRVLQTGGLVVLLELTRPQVPILRLLHHIYLKLYVQWVGGLIGHSPEAYEHLRVTIDQFPPNDAILRLLEMAGFDSPRCIRLTGGIAALFHGTAGRRPQGR